MESSLPASIATYLQEAGFSGTEIAVIRKLLEGETLTLREIAAKTSKSTGVLDQAMKKLLQKGLVTREIVNTVPRYGLTSLQTIVEWMQEDMALKQDMLQRKHQNFESFVRSLTVGKKRPEMEFYEGMEAIKRSYMQLLERGNDIIQYGPVLWASHEDPYHAFWPEYVHERQRRGIFARVITNGTPLGRRYQSRDPFEYRKTILVDRADFPFRFEKIVIGDTVACFQLEDERACFIRFPELAQDERIFFERIWNRQVQQSKVAAENAQPPLPEIIIMDPVVSKNTRAQLREFFFGRRSLLTFALFGVCALLVTVGVYRMNVANNVQNIRDKALSVAATAAVQFDADDLDLLRSIDDIHRPEYKKVVYQLNQIRNQNPIVSNVYILRLTDDPNIWEFVADADSLDPFAEVDLNDDGVIDDADQLSPPGEPYDVTGQEYEMDVVKPTVSVAPIMDQWGNWYSANAPIRNNRNELVAILGIDIAASNAHRFSNIILWMVGAFFTIFLILTFIRLTAFYNKLIHDLWVLFRYQLQIFAMLISIIPIFFIIYNYYSYTIAFTREQVGNRLMAIASVAAVQISAEDLDAIRFARDMQKEEYQRVFAQLNVVRQNNPDIRHVYIWRPTETEGIWQYVADADSNVDNPFEENLDLSSSNQMEKHEYRVPGVRCDIVNIAPNIYRDGFQISAYEVRTVMGEKLVTGTSPIFDGAGNAVALFAVEVDISDD